MPPTPRDQLLSVVMPVHNALPHLDEAVRSILDQSWTDFEFVILDDGSTDGSTERLRYWAQRDPRIRLFESGRNLGPAASSNAVVRKSTRPLIARMDADDRSHPDRLRREIELLLQRPDVGLVGTLCDIIDANGSRLRRPELWRVVRRSWFAPFPHGSIMFRRELFDRIDGYRKECEFWEDQDFALRLAHESRILVIPEALYEHRQSITSTRVASDQLRVERAVDLMYRSMGRLKEKRRYDDLLVEQAEPAGNLRIDPRVFISLGSLVLWSDGRPKLLGRLFRRGRLSFDLATATTVIWTAWAALSPGTLRAFVSMLSRVKNAIARRSRAEQGAIEWAMPSRLDRVEPAPRHGTASG